METHAHDLHKAPSQGWKHYFFEFFMLFLAVSLGFFVENIRENYVEKERAAELAKSFYEEVKADSVVIETTIANRVRRDSALTYLQKYFRDSSVVNCSKAFAVNFNYGFAALSPYLFEPKDAIVDQLKNSGSLRYFKSMELQKLTGDLSVAIASIRVRNTYESNYSHDFLLPYLVKHNDMQLYDYINPGGKLYFLNAIQQYENSNEVFPFHFYKPDDFDRIESVNTMGVYQIIGRGATRKQYADYI